MKTNQYSLYNKFFQVFALCAVVFVAIVCMNANANVYTVFQYDLPKGDKNIEVSALFQFFPKGEDGQSEPTASTFEADHSSELSKPQEVLVTDWDGLWKQLEHHGLSDQIKIPPNFYDAFDYSDLKFVVYSGKSEVSNEYGAEVEHGFIAFFNPSGTGGTPDKTQPILRPFAAFSRIQGKINALELKSNSFFNDDKALDKFVWKHLSHAFHIEGLNTVLLDNEPVSPDLSTEIPFLYNPSLGIQGVKPDVEINLEGLASKYQDLVFKWGMDFDNYYLLRYFPENGTYAVTWASESELKEANKKNAQPWLFGSEKVIEMPLRQAAHSQQFMPVVGQQNFLKHFYLTRGFDEETDKLLIFPILGKDGDKTYLIAIKDSKTTNHLEVLPFFVGTSFEGSFMTYFNHDNPAESQEVIASENPQYLDYFRAAPKDCIL